MDSQPTLQQLVAGLLRVDPGQIENSTSLEPLAGSLNRAKLSFALQRVGKTLPDNWFPGSFGELAGFVSGAETVEVPVAPYFTLTGNVFNLTDTHYEYFDGVPASGITFRLGGRLEFPVGS